ncbi:MAG: DoxX family protein [Gemmatimonadetes bacterium]|nr:DoxX family protein [Gemmatimonadota bacterium]
MSRERTALLTLRVAVATILVIHGSYRALHAGYVAGFGEFLTSTGVPLGGSIAVAITAGEIVGGLALAAGRLVVPLALLFAAELAVGIVMVHAPEGWFVVGGGRNGMEYSVLLIVVLLAVAWGNAGRPE